MKFLLLMIFSPLFIISCGSTARYTQKFDNDKSSIDTLVFLKPYVVVEDIQTGVNTPDLQLKDTLEKSIIAKVQAMFKGKYVLHYDSVTLRPASFKTLDTVLRKLHSKETFSEVNLAEVFKNTAAFPTRYTMLLAYYGSFHGKYPPNYNLRRGVMTGMIDLSANNSTESVMRVLIIDNSSGKIVYYDDAESSQDDPRSLDKMERTAARLLKFLYYK